jgi:phosphoglucosamine mutase
VPSDDFGGPSRLFGTDGIRGVANTELTADLALALGRAAAEVLDRGPVLVGRDTRRSGDMLSAALQAGLHSAGIDTVDVNVLTSGGIAHLTAATGAAMGAVVSASHNPAEDNGIKLLGTDGSKLSDAQEEEIERLLRSGGNGERRPAEGVGMRADLRDAVEIYVEHLVGQARATFDGLPVVLDCANGAAHRAAPLLFERLGARVELLAAEPDGSNINLGCGATHPAFLAARVAGRMGLAFDGDADRLIAVDEDGMPANGDVVMAIIARHWAASERLRPPTVVTTVMANLGFRKAMQAHGIEVVETQVGDRYVMEEMRAHHAVLGGEQSGHVIFSDLAPTGDGLLTGMLLLEVVAATGSELRTLRKEAITEFPQVLLNVRVANRDRLGEADAVWAAVRRAEEQLGNDGRILVRASGTEPLARVMVEAPDEATARAIAGNLASVVAAELS